VSDVAAKTVLSEFTSDLSRVEQLLNFILDFREFAGLEIESDSLAYGLWSSAENIRTDLPILSGSLMLYLCGRFEHFVRELVGAVVDDLVDSATGYEDLPGELRKVYVTRTLAINENPSKYSYTRETAGLLAAELADNLTGRNDGSSSLRVNASVITITDSNMRPLILSDLFKRVGITNVWDTLGKQLPLKTHLGKVADDECKKAAVARLEDIMTERNRIAHPVATGATVFPDASIVKGMAEYFRILAHMLTDLAIAPR